MVLSKTAISLLCVFLLTSIFVNHLWNIIATDHNYNTENETDRLNHSKYLAEKYGKITDTTKNLIWFLQISDIHISIFRDPGRISQFQQFCDHTVKKINPPIVLATGDLTDAKTKDNLGSSQVDTEWKYYHNIIKESGVTKSTVWLDIRGNHDNFNVKSINAKENYFTKYSVQGPTHTKSYLHVENWNGVKVAFVGIDACPDPGIKRPFNFIGILDTEEQSTLQKLQTEAAKRADHIVWFAHYPTSCIVAIENDKPRLNLRELIGKAPGSQVYVSGHLHTMAGLVTEMYTRHKGGFVELELGDWKDNRMFRLLAIDHGLLSFVDQTHNFWPIILVTNPKNARFTMPRKEPLQLMSQSTHVRILVFNDVELREVVISFDRVKWKVCKNKEGPLYVCEWEPHLYKSGLHTLSVKTIDTIGRDGGVEHKFSLDGTRVKFEYLPRILLMFDAPHVFQTIFGILLILNVVPLVLMRFQTRPPRCINRLYRAVSRQIWMLSKVDKVYYPMVLYAIYVPLGPWLVGELIDGYIGAVFAWGVMVKGAFIPEPFTYMYGSVQLMFIQLPLLLVLAYTLDKRLYEPNLRGLDKFTVNIAFVLILSFQMLLAYFFWLEYGTLALICGPLRSWSVILSLLLWYKIQVLPPDYCLKLLTLTESSPY